LTAYGKHFLADPKRWPFVTGDQKTLNHLGFDEFKLNAVDGSLVHSTRFVLLDGRCESADIIRPTRPGFRRGLRKICADWRKDSAAISCIRYSPYVIFQTG
jgi:cytochrome oxidase Cu insertion factor (SCO1/SenC/PrrC family)